MGRDNLRVIYEVVGLVAGEAGGRQPERTKLMSIRVAWTEHGRSVDRASLEFGLTHPVLRWWEQEAGMRNNSVQCGDGLRRSERNKQQCIQSK